MTKLQPVQPSHTLDLFPPLSRELSGGLRMLVQADWQRPTACAGWTVKDVAAHLLGGSLSRVQDFRSVSGGANTGVLTYDELLRLIDQQNAQWVSAARRITPSLLIEFLALADQRMIEYFRSLDMAAPARSAVAWAGESQSANWFDVAREYTEKWLHQQHIREAVGQPLLLDRTWLFPVLDTFARALPFTYRPVSVPEGAAIVLLIHGAAGGAWSLVRQNREWALYTGAASDPISQVEVDADLAWRLFTRGIKPGNELSRVCITGDLEIGQRMLQMSAIMA